MPIVDIRTHWISNQTNYTERAKPIKEYRSDQRFDVEQKKSKNKKNGVYQNAIWYNSNGAKDVLAAMIDVNVKKNTTNYHRQTKTFSNWIIDWLFTGRPNKSYRLTWVWCAVSFKSIYKYYIYLLSEVIHYYWFAAFHGKSHKIFKENNHHTISSNLSN